LKNEQEQNERDARGEDNRSCDVVGGKTMKTPIFNDQTLLDTQTFSDSKALKQMNLLEILYMELYQICLFPKKRANQHLISPLSISYTSRKFFQRKRKPDKQI
jgi:hypothetical protein